MAKIKVDTTGVEVQPAAVKPGLYTVKITEAEAREAKSSGALQLAVIYEVSGGEFDGRKLFDYIPLANDEMAFRLAAFLDALGLPRKGTLDTDKIVGKKLKVRTVVQKSEEYGEQARVRNVLPLKESSSEDLDADDEAEDEDEDEVDYNEMDLDELIEELEAREIKVPKKKNKKSIIQLLEENDEENAEDEDEGESDADSDNDDETEDEDESAEDEEDDEDEDYSDMDIAELKKLAKQRKVEVTGKVTKSKLVAALEETEDEDEDKDEDEEQDYDEMDIDELKHECKERGLKTTGKKSQLVARLEKDDKSGNDGEPF